MKEDVLLSTKLKMTSKMKNKPFKKKWKTFKILLMPSLMPTMLFPIIMKDWLDNLLTWLPEMKILVPKLLRMLMSLKMPWVLVSMTKLPLLANRPSKESRTNRIWLNRIRLKLLNN